LTSWKISAIALNGDVLSAAQTSGTRADLWDRARASRVVLMSPELLKSDVVRVELNLDGTSSKFKQRCTVLVCDEAHLVWSWGRHWREAYVQIGPMRNRLHDRTRLLLLTATLRKRALEYVLSTFGLTRGHYFDMHRSIRKIHLAIK